MQRKTDPVAAPGRLATVQNVLDGHAGRGPGFDTVRLVAAAAVLLHHALGIEIDIVHDDPLFTFSRGYTHLGLLAVSVFFAISGFLVTPGLARKRDVIEYLSRRFMRIMPLLVSVVAFTALVLGPLLTTLAPGSYFASPATWLYFKNVTTLLSLPLPGVTDHTGGNQINTPLWTLHYEWLCYFLLAAASLGGLLQRRVLFTAAWAGSIAAMLLVYGPLAADVVRGRAFTVLFLFGYFGAGVVIYLFADRLRWSVPLILGALAALAISYAAGLAFVLGPILTAYVVVGFGLVRLPWSERLARVDLSYGVYLTHALVLAAIMYVFPVRSALVLFALALPLSLAVAWLTWTVIEKPALARKSLPGQIVRRLFARRDATAARQSG